MSRATWVVFPLLVTAVIAVTLFLLGRQVPPPGCRCRSCSAAWW